MYLSYAQNVRYLYLGLYVDQLTRETRTHIKILALNKSSRLGTMLSTHITTYQLKKQASLSVFV